MYNRRGLEFACLILSTIIPHGCVRLLVNDQWEKYTALNSAFQSLGKEMGRFIPIRGTAVAGGCRDFILVGAHTSNLRAEVCATTNSMKKNFALLCPLLDLQLDTQIIRACEDLRYSTTEALGRASRTLVKWMLVNHKHHLAFQVFT